MKTITKLHCYYLLGKYSHVFELEIVEGRMCFRMTVTPDERKGKLKKGAIEPIYCV